MVTSSVELLWALPLVLSVLVPDVVGLSNSRTCQNFTVDEDYSPTSPLVLCCLVPEEFYMCEEPKSSDDGNATNTSIGIGYCSKFGGQYYEDVENTSVQCQVVEGVMCHGNTSFVKTGVPCIKYNGHYFPTILLYSVFMGFLGIDRFCLGYTWLGVAKVLTLGGIGVWWVVDAILLMAGMIAPANEYSWEQFY